MSMHLVGPYMTTTNYKKRKQKGLTKKDRQAQADHDKWLTKMGVHPDQLAEKRQKMAITASILFQITVLVSVVCLLAIVLTVVAIRRTDKCIAESVNSLG